MGRDCSDEKMNGIMEVQFPGLDDVQIVCALETEFPVWDDVVAKRRILPDVMSVDGEIEGVCAGEKEGDKVGDDVDGEDVGVFVGEDVVGEDVGLKDGDRDGLMVGFREGARDGGVGGWEGVRVGWHVLLSSKGTHCNLVVVVLSSHPVQLSVLSNEDVHDE